ncbi:hypothetical protein O181_055698 [Austropuccinia psidii MF-1]|uniref:Uncharacterized protein n=1 Tax=Austropuccinia psidii MF-1 TaxID=1389203 RepID=A0A9Q3EBQ4_9BASI|nr:hypothetical protein [Austropuccinia psidii MF-1]
MFLKKELKFQLRKLTSQMWEESSLNKLKKAIRKIGIFILASTSSRSVQGQSQKTSEQMSQEPLGKGKRKENWHRPYPQGHRIPKLEPSAVDSVFNMAGTLMEFTAKEQERMNRTFYTNNTRNTIC